jgi:hypothetical protein
MKNGVYAYLDQWDIKPGTDIAHFMELLTQSTWVGIVCTPQYAKKCEQRASGVGYEARLITRQILSALSAVGGDRIDRFIPLLRSGSRIESMPSYMPDTRDIDFRSDENYQTSLEELLRLIFDKPLNPRPQLGPAPPFAIEAGQIRWILVAGSGREDKLSNVVEETSKLLGNMLAHNGFGLVSGGWQGVDRVVARSFAMALYPQDRPLEKYLVQVVRRDWQPVFPGGNLIFVAPGEEEWTKGIERADAVVLIEGFGGTLTTGRLARSLGKPVLPLADTGNDAKTVYWQILRDAENKGSHTIERLPREEFMKLSRPAPAVVSILVDLLGRAIYSMKRKHLRRAGCRTVLKS